MKQSLTIAAGYVKRFYRSLIDWEITEEQIFAVSHLKKEQLENPDNRIPVEKYIKLGRMAPELTNLPEIGLILGQRAAFESIGIVFQVAINCKTVRESLIHVAKYSNLGNEASKAEFEEGNEFAEWSEHCINSRYLCIPLIEFESCQKLRICKSVLGEDFRPVQMKFQHAPPDYVDEYYEIFRAPLMFEQEKSAIVFRKEYLDMPNPNPQPYVKELLSRHADTLEEEIEKNNLFQDKVRKIVLRHLEFGSVSLELIAKELNVSSRTIYRKLKNENTFYKQLLSEVRKELAHDYLKEGSFSINDISSKLGFSESSAFNRAFKRWFATNPSQYRQQVMTANMN
jgi:AraC-like DNA-binding protein